MTITIKDEHREILRNRNEAGCVGVPLDLSHADDGEIEALDDLVTHRYMQPLREAYDETLGFPIVIYRLTDMGQTLCERHGILREVRR